MWPQIVPYVAARQTLDDLLPRFTLLSDALRDLAKDVERVAKGTDKLREWVEKMAGAKWHIEDEPNDPPGSAPAPSGDLHIDDGQGFRKTNNGSKEG